MDALKLKKIDFCIVDKARGDANITDAFLKT